MPNTDKPSRVLTSLRAAVTALADRGPLTPQELATAIEIPRPSAYRLAGALVQDGLAVQRANGSVGLSTHWLHLADRALECATSWFQRDDLLERLRDQTRLTVYLSVPRPHRAVCVRRLHGQGVQVLVLKPGGSLPLHLGGVGRITLAFGDEDPEEYLREMPASSPTERSLVNREEVLADVELSRQRGYCVSDEDVTVGVGAVAAPVIDANGHFIAALSVAGLRDAIVGQESTIAEQVRSIATEIGAAALSQA